MAKKRTTAQRRAAAKEAWARRRANAALAAVPKFHPTTPVNSEAESFTWVQPSSVATPPVTVSVTHEGKDFYLGINNNGSLHRVKVTPDTLKAMALDALRII